jgi:hypothetical protein
VIRKSFGLQHGGRGICRSVKSLKCLSMLNVPYGRITGKLTDIQQVMAALWTYRKPGRIENTISITTAMARIWP